MDTNHQDKIGNKQIKIGDNFILSPLSPKEQKEVKQIQKYLKKSFVERMGFSGKKPWDLIQLLLIPLIIAGIGYWFTGQQNQTDLQVSENQQQAMALQTYLDDMSNLLLSNNYSPPLYQAKKKDEIRIVAIAKTLVALERLDKKRKRSIMLFLYSADLITWHNLTSAPFPNENAFPLVSLSTANLNEADLSGVYMSNADLYNTDLTNADLSNSVLVYDNLSQSIMHQINLSGAVLHGADLSGADLSGANLSDVWLNCNSVSFKVKPLDFKKLLPCPNLDGTNLSGANLSGTHLQGVNLSRADLSGADLSGAILKGATVTKEQLAKVKSLQGTIMPDGSKHYFVWYPIK